MSKITIGVGVGSGVVVGVAVGGEVGVTVGVGKGDSSSRLTVVVNKKIGVTSQFPEVSTT